MSKSKPPKIDPTRPLAAQAVMNVDKGEEIVGGWVTPHIPGTGVYKILAKKKKDGACEWAHFVQRDNGIKENVTRGVVESEERLQEVLDICNSALHKAFGLHVTFHRADADVYTLDGKKALPTVH